MALEFRANQDRIAAATDRFERLRAADGAQRDFGEMRYWLTELSVSLLTLSERRAEAARDRLDTSLEPLAAFAPEAARDIAEAAEAFWQSGIAAVDEYTNGNRIVGNMLIADARVQGEAVDTIIATLIDELSASAVAATMRAGEAARAAQRRALITCSVIVLAGLAGTALLLRSILRPLRRIDRAMVDIQEGRAPADPPPEGPDELGRMATSLRVLGESQAARRRLEAEAAAQRRTVVTAIETVPQGFVLFDAADRLVLRNARFDEMFPDAAGLPEGTTFEALLDAGVEGGGGQDRMHREDRLARHLAPRPGRDEIQVDSGWLAVTKRRTPDGGTVAVYEDVTETRARQLELDQSRREAEAANVAKSRFLASMSHELRTPLNAIIGYSEMLIEDAEDEGETATVADLERITGAGKHLLSLINDILDLSKIEAGKMDVQIEEVDVAEMTEDVRLTVAPLIAEKGNVLRVDVGDGIGRMRTDRTKLRQNLFNLLSNAAKFTEGGEIVLSAEADGSEIVFAVADDGIGMSEAQMGRIFEPFAQAESSTSTVYGGTGLGLSLVRQFAGLLGGTIGVTSAPGKGARFELRLPRGGDMVEARPQDVPAIGALRALVIDDDPAARDRLAGAVREAGYIPLVAEGAESGLALAREHRPDVVLLDIIMPGRDGWSVLRELKRDPVLCETPVVVVSMISDPDMGAALGASDVLVKPVSAGELAKALGGAVSEVGREALVVDDDPATRALFRRVLVRAGWSVREAADGERALVLTRERMPDLIVLDLLMPARDGFSTLRALRDADDTRALPVIVATSKDLSRDERRLLDELATDVIHKGAGGRADLMAAIARHVVPPAMESPKP
ncbi:MAG: response regulator [Jannaschia sp.]